MNLKRSSSTDSASNEKLNKILKIHGAHFEGKVLEISHERFPSVHDRIRIPTSNIPILFMKDESDDLKKTQ